MAENLTRNLTTFLESARDLTLEAASLASSNLMQEQSGVNLSILPQDLSKLLNSRSDKEKLIGLKTVITFMSTNLHDDTFLLQFFPDVIKNITSTNLNIKKLVYIYLLRFNHLSQDTALLSINAIQKSTVDKDPVLRSLLIRTLSGIHIPAIIPILLISIQKCVNDSSPFVRASAAVAIVKCYKLESQFNGTDSLTLRQLVGYVKELLLETDVRVLNSAVIAFGQILGKNYELLHEYFHHLISKLPELETWSQIILIDLLINYCKLYCTKPTDDYSDTIIFLNGLKPLVYSQSTLVILAIAKLYVNLGTGEMLKESNIHLSLLKFMKTNDVESTYLLLEEILVITKIDPSIFMSHINQFFLYPLELEKISIIKLQILSNLITQTNYESTLRELRHYASKSLQPRVKLEAIKAISKIVSKLSNIELNTKVLKWCFLQINQDEPDDLLVDEILVCIRYIMSQAPQFHVQTLLQLTSKLLFSANNFNSSSKASIIWLIGEFVNLNLLSIQDQIPDILRALIKQNFFYYESKSEKVRLEILNLSCKSWCKELYQWKLDNDSLIQQNDQSSFEMLSQQLDQLAKESNLLKLYSYCLYLCKVDESLDIRNEARKFNELLPSVNLDDIENFDHALFLHKLSTNIELAILILEAEKPTPTIDSDSTSTLHDIIRYDQSLNVFLKYYNLTENWSDKPLSNDLRITNLKVKDFHAVAKSVSSKQVTGNNSSSRYNGFGNQDLNADRISEFTRARTPETTSVLADGKRYQLQSLDEFFESSESEEEEEEESSDEEEGSSEESEDSSDENSDGVTSG